MSEEREDEPIILMWRNTFYYDFLKDILDGNHREVTSLLAFYAMSNQVYIRDCNMNGAYFENVKDRDIDNDILISLLEKVDWTEKVIVFVAEFIYERYRYDKCFNKNLLNIIFKKMTQNSFDEFIQIIYSDKEMVEDKYGLISLYKELKEVA